MARPKKEVVDWFPHYCVSKKTMFILEQKFGNNGYAFWFKLLEVLGTQPGHFIDLNDTMQMEFLQAKTRMDGITTVEMLDLLSNLQAIDSELWSRNVVWSENFVTGVEAVYTNRRVETPKKPSFYIEKYPKNGISTHKSTQREVERSRENNNNNNNIKNEEEIKNEEKNVDDDEKIGNETSRKNAENITEYLNLPDDKKKIINQLTARLISFSKVEDIFIENKTITFLDFKNYIKKRNTIIDVEDVFYYSPNDGKLFSLLDLVFYSEKDATFLNQIRKLKPQLNEELILKWIYYAANHIYSQDGNDNIQGFKKRILFSWNSIPGNKFRKENNVNIKPMQY